MSQPSEHDRDRLLAQLAGCLDLTTAAVLAADDDGPHVVASVAGSAPPAPLVAQKVVAESSLLARAAVRVAASPSLDLLLGELLPRARPTTLPAALCLDAPHALNHAYAHVQLGAAGLPDPLFDTLLEQALETPRTGGSPSGADDLENRWLVALLRGEDLSRDRDLIARTPLGAPYDALGASLQDGYELTHAVLQSTDLGAWTCAAGRSFTELVADADALLAAALDSENLDLAAEVLWTFPMLRLPLSAPARLAWRLLSGAFERHGFLPGPGYDAADASALSGAARRTYELRTSYHTTLVWGLLCAATLLAPPPAPRVRAMSGTGPAVFALLGPASTSWEQESGQPEELAAFALTVALRRAHRSGDLASLCRGLAVAVECGLADGPAVAQALHVVRRSSLVTAAAAPAPPAPVGTCGSAAPRPSTPTRPRSRASVR